jgi:nucleolar protein 9
MTALVLSSLTELLPTLKELIFSPYASHCIRSLLYLLSGVPYPSESSVAGKGKGTTRSKKSRQWRAGKGQLETNFLDPSSSRSRPSDSEEKAVPAEFSTAYLHLTTTLLGSLSDRELREATLDAVAGPVVKIILELESLLSGWKAGGWGDRVLSGLLTALASPGEEDSRAEEREEFLNGLLRSPAGAPTFESILRHSPRPVFEKLWETQFATKLARVAGNAVANFPVAVGISRLSADMFQRTVQEISTIAVERRGEWVDNARLGVLSSLFERSAELGVMQAEISKMVVETFGVEEDEKLLVPCVLSLNRLEVRSFRLVCRTELSG